MAATEAGRRGFALPGRVVEIGTPVLFGIALFALWEGAVRLFRIPLYIVPPPSDIVVQFVEKFPRIWEYTLVTGMEALVGFFVSILVAVPLSLMVAFSPLLRRTLYPFAVAMEMVPKIAFAPIFVTWFGFGFMPKIIIVYLVCFFPILLNGILAFWMLLTRMYPAIATAIPYFLIMRDLHLLDTLPALIVTYTAFNLPFVIWLLIGFYEELPIELERAAMIDGCSVWTRFRKIVLPLSAPALVATAILSAVLAWNEFLFAVMLTRVNAKTLPVVMSGFITDKGTQWDQMTALGVITVLPVLAFALAVQRYLVRGLTLGAVKE